MRALKRVTPARPPGDWLGDDPTIKHDIEAERIWVTAYRGDLVRAEAQLRERIDLFMEQGSTLWAASWLGWGVAWCQEWAGDLPAAVETLRTAEHMQEVAGETGSRSTVLATLALLLARLGRVEEPQAILGESRRISGSGDLINDLFWATTEGLLHAIEGAREESELSFDAALEVAAGTEFMFHEGLLWLVRSEARELLDDRAGAIDAAHRALSLFERKGFGAPIEVVRARLAGLGAN